MSFLSLQIGEQGLVWVSPAQMGTELEPPADVRSQNLQRGPPDRPEGPSSSRQPATPTLIHSPGRSSVLMAGMGEKEMRTQAESLLFQQPRVLPVYLPPSPV